MGETLKLLATTILLSTSHFDVYISNATITMHLLPRSLGMRICERMNSHVQGIQHGHWCKSYLSDTLEFVCQHTHCFVARLGSVAHDVACSYVCIRLSFTI